MTFYNRREAVLLLAGDVTFLVFSLWLSLSIRNIGFAEESLFFANFWPFVPVFFASVLTFFIAGLYGKHTVFFKRQLPKLLFRSQIINALLAATLFYLLPWFSIAPKTILGLYILFSFLFLVLWRLFLVPMFGVRKREKAVLIGKGEEAKELLHEVNHNSMRYGMRFSFYIDLDKFSVHGVSKRMRHAVSEGTSLVVLDLSSRKIEPLLESLYGLLPNGVRFVHIHEFYQDVFDRVPVSMLRYEWILGNISPGSHSIYDFFKRSMDISLSLVLGLLSLLCYPFVIMAIKQDDGGAIFSHQRRIGKDGKLFSLMKFRTMSVANDDGKWGEKNKNKVTRVGAFLRKTRIDELPQLLNVLKGDISLIGPRPEFSDAVRKYESEIPFYGLRHIIKPGLSGWAQMFHEEHPHHGLNIKETRKKLSYDLYYIKNRSLWLDIKISLMTIKTLLSRSGV